METTSSSGFFNKVISSGKEKKLLLGELGFY